MSVKKVHIASSRFIGNTCRDWAALKLEQLESNYIITNNMDDCDVFISVLYDKLLSSDFIDGNRRCYNFHPGILPDYRGAGAYSWVLINKEKETGVTLHEIDYSIDSGPIIDIRKTLIYESDTAETLYDRCMALLFKMFQDRFLDIIYDSYQTRPNNGGKVYYRKDLEDAKDITNIVRAFTFSGKENAYYINSNGKKIYIKL